MSLREEIEASGFTFRRRALDDGQRETLRAMLPGETECAETGDLLWASGGGLRATLAYLGLDRLATEALGYKAFPIKATYLVSASGTSDAERAYQDLLMPFEQEGIEAGFVAWVSQDGVTMAEPPLDVLTDLVALRIYLDDGASTQGAIAVIPGSHRWGKLLPEELADLGHVEFTALEAAPADVVLMKPLLVRRASPIEAFPRQRVLEVAYATDEPGRKVRWRRSPTSGLSVDVEPAQLQPPHVPTPAELTALAAHLARPKEWGPIARFFAGLVGTATFFGFIGFVLRRVAKVQDGAGGEIYQSMRGYRMSSIAVLVVLVVGPIAFAVGSVIGWRQRREQREFDRRYPKAEPGRPHLSPPRIT